MWWMTMVALAGRAPAELSEPVWLTSDAANRVCVSMVPGAGGFKNRDAAAWSAARTALASNDVAGALAAVKGAKDHPAKRTLKTAAYVLGEGVAIDLSPLADKYPEDGCLQFLAASAALQRKDMTAVRRHLEAARVSWPDSEEIASMRVLMMPEGKERTDFIKAELDRNPDDVRMLTMLAQIAESEGDIDTALSTYRRLVALGNPSLAKQVAPLALRAGDLDLYLQLVTPGHPVVGVDLTASASPAADYRRWLGLENPEQSLTAVFTTSKGELRCVLDPDNAPMTVMNFVGLARGEQPLGDGTSRKLYDGTLFHRVIPEFMVQAGDPEGTGKGGPGYRFADEPSPRGKLDRPGLLAMANAGPDTNGSQFFITEVPTPHLSGKHTVFGSCDARSLALVKEIARVPTDARGLPEDPVVLESVTFEVR